MSTFLLGPKTLKVHMQSMLYNVPFRTKDLKSTWSQVQLHVPFGTTFRVNSWDLKIKDHWLPGIYIYIYIQRWCKQGLCQQVAWHRECSSTSWSTLPWANKHFARTFAAGNLRFNGWAHLTYTYKKMRLRSHDLRAPSVMTWEKSLYKVFYSSSLSR